MKYFFTRASLVLAALLCMQASSLAQFSVSGTVTDQDGVSLIGVSILVKGSSVGTVSDLDGSYELNIPGSNAILEFSYTGFKAVNKPVSAENNKIDVMMSEDITNLEEIVVSGLASTIKRSNLANAVATISNEEITGVTTQQTLDGALYGKLPGVNVVQNNGAPGGGIAIRLRGVSSLSGNNQPLIILDGVYITNAEIPSGSRFASGANVGIEEGSSNRLADINPDDIESIEVLKGASAAAIYGTRANAGVMIITTKKGKAGDTKVSLEQDLGFNTISNKVGRRTFANKEEVAAAFPTEPNAPIEWEAARQAGKIFDYEDEIYGETGLISETRLNVSGGNQKTQFYISGGYRNEDGIIKNTGFDRFSARLNITHEISKSFTISTSTNYVNSAASRSFTGNENEGGLSYGYTLAFTRDYVDLHPDEDGNYPDNPNYTGNPLFVRDHAKNEEDNNRFIQGARFEWKALQLDNQVLRFVVNGGFDILNNETFVYVPETHQAQRGLTNGFVGVGKNKISNYNYQVTGSHDFYTAAGLSFSTQAGISYLNIDRDFLLNRTTQLIPLQTNVSQGGAQVIEQTLENEEEFGFIVQESVNWDDKIIGTVGVRLDKSSLNGDPNKYYTFPRASLALNIANFDFWNAEQVEQFKLRIAYGETGNSATYSSLFTSLENLTIGGSSGFVNDRQQGNPNLAPEISSELEFGADFTFLNGKVGLEVTYYIRKVKDLLYDRSLPTSSGFTNEIRNDLDLENRGFELSLLLNPVRSTAFSWSSSFNFWFNNSEITRLGIPDGDEGEDIPSFVPPNVGFGFGLGTFYINEGSSITAFWGRDDAGNPAISGDASPDFQLGWYNQLKFGKRLTLNFLAHWKQGGEVLNLTRLLSDSGVTTPNEDLDIEGFIEDASYLRLREIGAYYTLPINGNFIESIRLGVSARNLFTLTSYSSYDPETSTKGGSGLSTGLEVSPFPSSKQAYFHISFNF
ncbi:MAG: SusC/RagA family TonB-linked outer membrane protein [Saprospiraceae bacterium]|nr:MAG: SusC/RagA family TonB-linked outer membrane protein [Saprospiraceae bacterium]